MDNSAAVQAIGLMIALIIGMFLYLESKNSSTKAWKMAALVTVIFGAPGAIHMMVVMYRNIL